ncbi:MAG: AAA family ATPase [Candidatus Thermoplasmatota archaeon]|nr:AAA family ATPase [Euryarchaeota archaeon]MBU4032832.1 AAA family ATPase [Candidatus Thermoplasmatota archaeon]MBU4071557.1 AAA family ATPase [Candidatus Thermoplasmatota archaeon]MBU4144483.1 AAA family ATPase [Candidatus Thermoplasmatota archaeon]MBU4592723.1 AAA family ATPase [Candidatus Thermoplasmatota archaeon]
MKKRVQTNIPGLDELMAGGIPEGHVVMISGLPGTMKSSLAYNILFNNAKMEGKKGLYISLEQGRDSITDHMACLGMQHTDVESLLSIVDMGYLRLHMDEHNGGAENASWIDIFKMYAENMHEKTEYELLVIDSLPVIELMARMDDRRNDLFHFFGWLRELGVTTFIVSETSEDAGKVLEEDFLSDGIIRVKKERQGQDISRQLVIDKMRSTKHNTGLFTLLHDGKEFRLTRAIGE